MADNRPKSSIRARLVHATLGVGILALVVVVASLLPVRQTETHPFATPAFQRVWNSETVSAARSVDLWGSEPLVWRVEPYLGALNDRRTVQYFDRGRMEVEAGSSQVTHGLLARELTSGKIDLGAGTSIERQPPEISIDSGPLDDEAPTYLTFSRLTGQPDVDRSRSNTRITAWVHRGGAYEGSTTPEVRRNAAFIEKTGHNLPDVTVNLFERPEFRDEQWIELVGYPISEPYWTYYRRGDEKLPSLIQVFERRILVYTPAMEPSRQFTIASTGRHYAQWRYGAGLESTPVAVPTETLDPDLTLEEDLSAYVYAHQIGTPIDLALSPSGHLLILTAEGTILRSDSLDPAGPPAGFSVWASGIDEPHGIDTRGASVVVTAVDRVWWFREEDGVGVVDEVAEALKPDESGETLIRGKPVSNSTGQIFARTSSNGSDEALREIGSNESLLVLDEASINAPGTFAFAGNDLLVAGADEDGRSTVFAFPEMGNSISNVEPVKIAAFPRGSAVRALAIADEVSWPISEFGDVIVAVDDGDEAHIFAVARNRSTDATEVVELVGGLSHPVAMVFGLDGSLYIADAEERQIIRVVHTTG